MLKKIKQNILRPKIGRPVMLSPLMRELGKTLPMEGDYYLLSGDNDYVRETVKSLAKDYRNATRGKRKVRKIKLVISPDISPNITRLCQECEYNRSCPNVAICCGGKVNVAIRVPCPKERWKL